MKDNDQLSTYRGTLVAAMGKSFPLKVCKSANGYYVGTHNEDGEPYTRESAEYWRKPEQALAALQGQTWTQRLNL